MRFSLQDLMWSVTLACGGLTFLGILFNADSWVRWTRLDRLVPFWFAIVLYLAVCALTGALFGAAIGKPFHKTWQVGIVGAFVFLLFAIPR